MQALKDAKELGIVGAPPYFSLLEKIALKLPLIIQG